MKPLSKMSLDELIDYWSGYLLIETGRGQFRTGVSLLIQSTIQEDYDRGKEEGKKTK